jgi:hypothetical protein
MAHAGKPRGWARPVMDRVMEKVEMLPWSGCWIYLGHIDKKGYGRIVVGSRSDGTRVQGERVHRVVYKERVGPIPEGLDIDHVRARGCVSRACCNTDHLEPVPPGVNTLRGDSPPALHARRENCRKCSGPLVYSEAERQRVCPPCLREYRRLQMGRRRLASRGGIPWAPKTHCLNGHELAGKNVAYYIKAGRKKPSRRCKACHCARVKAAYRARQATVSA